MFDWDLNLNMDFFSSIGLTLSVEEQLMLEVSLNILKQENKFQSISFQAKILCSKGNYYIAIGRGKDYIRSKMFFYSTDACSWRMLFPPNETDLSQFRLARNLFTGDPIHIHRFYVGNEKVAMREESRLSAAVHLLDWETAAGPKGALEVTTQGIVQQNPYFKSVREANHLESYVHHRLPKCQNANLAPTLNLCSAAGDSALEFLEPIVVDYPPGCWWFRSDPIRHRTRLQNLWWPGHNFCCCTESNQYASIYIGTGIRNDDLPFMI